MLKMMTSVLLAAGVHRDDPQSRRELKRTPRSSREGAGRKAVRRIRRLELAAFALGGFLLSGCAPGLKINPPKPSGMPRAEAPVALKVGVYMKRPRFDFQEMGGLNTQIMEGDRRLSYPMWSHAEDIGAKFLRALQASSAFSQVDEVKSTDANDHDLIIDADFSGKYTKDPAAMPKALMSGFLFFLPVPFVTYNDAYFAAAEMNVYDRTGRLHHKYSESQDVTTSVGVWWDGSQGTIAAGIDAVAANLAVKLVTALIADRAGYQTPAAVSEPLSAAEPATGTTVADAPAAADPVAPAEIAEAKPAPKPAPRAPLTPSEESAIDDQIMP